MVLLVAPCWLWPQSYEVLHEGIFKVKNRWTFESQIEGQATTFTTTWEIRGTDEVSGHETAILRETLPGSAADLYVYLDQAAMVIVRIEESTGTPTTQVEAVFTDPLEKIPRFVSTGDDKRPFGHGEWRRTVVGDPAAELSAIQDQAVSFNSTDTITVGAAQFECVVFTVDEQWHYSNGWRGEASRTFWMNRVIGPLKMEYDIKSYDPDDNLYSEIRVTHELEDSKDFFTPFPDLTADRIWFEPQSLRAGERLTVGWRESCDFAAATTTHSTTLYLTTDMIVGADDFLVTDSVVIAKLRSGESHETSVSLAIPTTVPSGDYYVAVVVDWADEVEELDERNTFFSTATLTVESGPDLVVRSGGFEPAALAPGGVVRVTATIANIGGATASTSSASVFLSPDQSLGSDDYVLVADLEVPSLSRGGEHTFSCQALVPPEFEHGSYHVIVQADSGGVVGEIDETNNILCLGGLVSIGLPDLAVGQVWSDDVTGPDLKLWVQATVWNDGVTTAPAVSVRVYLSTDTVITTSDRLLQGSLRTPELPPGDMVVVNANPTIPSDAPVGVHYVGIVLDEENQLNEADERNNVATATVTIRHWPDLWSENFDFSPMVLDPGEAISFSGQIRYLGDVPSTEPFWVEFYVSPNEDFSPPRYYLCDSLRIERLEPGGWFSLDSIERTVYEDVAPGVYTVGIVIDPLKRIPEANESNNVAWRLLKRLRVEPRTLARRWYLYR